MYAEINGCNTLDFQLGPTGIGTTIPTRQWNIKVRFYIIRHQWKWIYKVSFPVLLLALDLGTFWATKNVLWLFFLNIAFLFQITQISCLDPNRAPNGCVQYYYGSTSGIIYSYNYAASTVIQLANQDQRICFRWEVPDGISKSKSHCQFSYIMQSITFTTLRS